MQNQPCVFFIDFTIFKKRAFLNRMQESLDLFPPGDLEVEWGMEPVVIPRSQVEDHLVEFVFCFFLYVVNILLAEGDFLPTQQVPQAVSVPLDSKAGVRTYLAERQDPAITGRRHVEWLNRNFPLFDSPGKEFRKGRILCKLLQHLLFVHLVVPTVSPEDEAASEFGDGDLADARGRLGDQKGGLVGVLVGLVNEIGGVGEKEEQGQVFLAGEFAFVEVFEFEFERSREGLDFPKQIHRV